MASLPIALQLVFSLHVLYHQFSREQPRASVSLVKATKTIVVLTYYFYQGVFIYFLQFWQGGSAVLVVSLGVTTPLVTPVTFSY